MRTEFEVIIERKDGEQFRYKYYSGYASVDEVKNIRQAIHKARQEFENEHKGIIISATRTKREK